VLDKRLGAAAEIQAASVVPVHGHADAIGAPMSHPHCTGWH
jgi:hypothetical protein